MKFDLTGLIVVIVICVYLAGIEKAIVDLKPDIKSNQCERDFNG